MITEEIGPDFNNGIIPEDQLKEFKNKAQGLTIDMLNSSFKYSMPSRLPIQVASITNNNENPQVEFYTEKLESIYIVEQVLDQ